MLMYTDCHRGVFIHYTAVNCNCVRTVRKNVNNKFRCGLEKK